MKTNLFPVLISAALFAAMTCAADCVTNVPRHSCCAMCEPASGLLSDKSLYQLDATWTNDLGKPVQMASLKGRVQVVAMFFTRCRYACPLLVYKLKQVEAALPANMRAGIGFTLASFDSEQDTPAALRNYRAQHELAGNWTLLNGTADDVLNLAALLGVKFSKGPQGQFLHSNVITILNAQGEIVGQETGLNPDIDEMVRQIEKLVKH
ncbi:MAG: SCO family protein [Limisphaerales bacterium]